MVLLSCQVVPGVESWASCSRRCSLKVLQFLPLHPFTHFTPLTDSG